MRKSQRILIHECLIVSGYIVLIILAVMWGLSQWAKTPSVYISYSTGKCVHVENYDPDYNYSCENIPAKYTTVNVK